MTKKIAVLSGDGIGPEIVSEALKVLGCLESEFGLKIETEEALIGGAAYDAKGTPFPAETLAIAKEADSILLGAVGGSEWQGRTRGFQHPCLQRIGNPPHRPCRLQNRTKT